MRNELLTQCLHVEHAVSKVKDCYPSIFMADKPLLRERIVAWKNHIDGLLQELYNLDELIKPKEVKNVGKNAANSSKRDGQTAVN